MSTTNTHSLTQGVWMILALVAVRMLTIGLLAVASANAQSDVPPAFEAASVRQRIRPAGSFLRRLHFNSGAISCSEPAATELFDCGISGTRFSDSPASLLDLIMDAYNVRANSIIGLPEWGDSGHDLYDVSARVGGDQTPGLDLVRRMLQTLLSDRFHLRLHPETKTLPVYELVVTKKSKLIKSANRCDPNASGSESHTVSIPERWEQLPARLSRNTDLPVMDRTGFEAEARYYLFPVQPPYSPDSLLQGALHPRGQDGIMTAPPDDLFRAINDLEGIWGLKLVPQKEPMDILVIDHVERPSAN
ncbi:MAG TPA: TIGR03435 family protein [Bryobacteraceae bacterium]|nr:TIGR03435 family protein [Bryobacteraceae bacterium]